MHQLGIKNVVASSGTSLTVEQIRMIRKFTNNVTIIYDGDGAGIKAALRGIGLVLKEGLNVKVILLPDGMDPDDFARRNTLEQATEYIAQHEQDFIGFKTDLLLGEAGNDPLKKATLINDVADTIALIPDAVIRAVYVKTCADKFEIDEQILIDRVNKSRDEMLIADRRQAEREAARAVHKQTHPADMPPPPEDYAPTYDEFGPVPEDYMPLSGGEPVYDEPRPVDMRLQPEPQQQNGVVIDDPFLEPCEKDLLKFILEHGCTSLAFDRDSKYFVPDEQLNVAEFIDGILAEDEGGFANISYRKVYDAYFEMYDEGLEQEQIQTRLLNSQDPQIAAVAKELLIEKYQITVENYEKSMTSTTTRLIQFVPKTLMTYQCRKVEKILKDLTAQLASVTDEAAMMEILTKISDYNKARTRLNNELGRVN
jgi:DNA primase